MPQIRTNARVARLIVRGGRVQGAVLDNGEEIHAPLVVTTLHPKIAFLEHIPRTELPDDFVTDIEHWKTRSGVVKINLALGELPNFTADPSDGLAEHHTGSVEMAPTMEFIEAAFQDARAGRPAAATVQRRRHPDHPGHDAQSRWHAYHVAVHAVGAGGLAPLRRTPRNSTPTPTG